MSLRADGKYELASPAPGRRFLVRVRDADNTSEWTAQDAGVPRNVQSRVRGHDQ